ncbi:MAG: hypothetical protein ACRCUS_00105, partial [Anaerovoracaceae bacterium]
SQMYTSCFQNVSKMDTSCFQNVSLDLDLGLDIDKGGNDNSKVMVNNIPSPISKKDEIKESFGPYQNVFLTETEVIYLKYQFDHFESLMERYSNAFYRINNRQTADPECHCALVEHYAREDKWPDSKQKKRDNEEKSKLEKDKILEDYLKREALERELEKNKNAPDNDSKDTGAEVPDYILEKIKHLSSKA